MKVANSYGSLLGGVSQQVPQDRSDGQHTEQVNMLSDPVNGLSRRHGSRWLAERTLPAMSGPPSIFSKDADKFRTFDFDTQGKEYSLLYAHNPRSSAAMGFMYVYNKTDKVWLDLQSSAGDSQLALLASNGVAAITQVGKYLVMAAKGVPITGSSSAQWSATNGFSVAWVRGGAYARTFTVKVVRTDGGVAEVSYTTPPSAYQGVLDTSDILADDLEYSKKVNDRVNAYNGAVTAWIGTASAAIQPAAIAWKLLELLDLQGVYGALFGSHIAMTNVRSISVDDGGNGELMRGVANDVESADDVSAIHYPGKTIKVSPKGADESFYLRAVAKIPGTSGVFTSVSWVEGPGTQHEISSGFFLATVDAGVFKVGSSWTWLSALNLPDVPIFPMSTTGDSDSSPVPYFVGRQVSYLGTFQNRLLVGSGGVVTLSKTDDYLNFFRSTVLTVPADDPFEMLPQGSEDDVIVSSVLYDRDLVLFGKKRQYSISGQVTLTPLSASMPVLANYENAADCPPVSAGGFIFYAKAGTSFSSAFQIQPGLTESSPESFPASSQIDSYLRGAPVEMMVATGSPSTLFLRTSGNARGLYTFSYLDKADGRKMDAWSRWEFNERLGPVVGMSVDTGGLTVFTMRQSISGVYYLVADFCSTSTGISETPYLDSQQTPDAISSKLGSASLGDGPEFSVAFPSGSTRKFTGAGLPALADFYTRYAASSAVVLVGANYDSYVTITNPYMRDGKDKAILSGRLTVTRFILALRQSVGCQWRMSYRDALADEREFNGRVLGSPNNQIGSEPVGDAEVAVPVGRETRQFTLTIAARKWMPFTLTAIEWVGQFFNRVQRF